MLGSLDDTTVLVAAVIALSAVLQTSTGFGFAILSAPLLTALVGGPASVTTITIAGACVDALILSGRRSRPRPHVTTVLTLAAWSTPGMVLGSLALIRLPKTALQLLVASAVALAIAHRLLGNATPSRNSRPWEAPLAGCTSGALATSTTLAGPPVVLYLARRLTDPGQTRDTLVALSLVRLPLSILILVKAGAWTPPGQGLPLIIVAALLGCAAGHIVHSHLDEERYKAATLLLLAVAAAGATIAAVS